MKILISLALFMLCKFSFVTASYAQDNFGSDVTEENIQSPNIRVIMFYSQNCPICEILRPKFYEALAAINQDSLDIIIFDFTTNESLENTKNFAEEEQLQDILRQFGTKTGFITIINKEGEIIERITQNDDVVEITEKLLAATLDN
ncbi:MAG: hypothetical protein AAF549_08935 [Pseudomonadota bacterium]